MIKRGSFYVNGNHHDIISSSPYSDTGQFAKQGTELGTEVMSTYDANVIFDILYNTKRFLRYWKGRFGTAWHHSRHAGKKT